MTLADTAESEAHAAALVKTKRVVPLISKAMYETEERMIEQAEHLAAELPVNLIGEGANGAVTITAVRSAINTRQSTVSELLSVYRELRRRAAYDAKCSQLSRRAWDAVLSVERDRDSLLFDLHQLQVEAQQRK